MQMVGKWANIKDTVNPGLTIKKRSVDINVQVKVVGFIKLINKQLLKSSTPPSGPKTKYQKHHRLGL